MGCGVGVRDQTLRGQWQEDGFRCLSRAHETTRWQRCVLRKTCKQGIQLLCRGLAKGLARTIQQLIVVEALHGIAIGRTG